jgi:hypothetical protein
LGEKFCKNCAYLFRVENRPEIFICTNKYNAPGKFFALTDDQPCRNHHEDFVPDRPQIRQSADGLTRFIPLTKGKIAVVDAADFNWLKNLKFYSTAKGYAVCNFNGRHESMHRLIMNPPPGLVVDHIDRNPLNNKRSNLRICTTKQNNYNRKRHNKYSKYKGIYWLSTSNKWRAVIHYYSKHIHLGYFDSEIETAQAYDKKAVELFGEFAYLNFPETAEIANITVLWTPPLVPYGIPPVRDGQAITP